MDPRVQRTTRALRKAVFQLAETKPIRAVTVAELARAAQITRGSFYNHATSPEDLLAQGLGAELDAAVKPLVHAASSNGELRRKALKDSVVAVWEHIRAHEKVYRNNLNPALRPVLESHFASRMREFFSDDLTLGMPSASKTERAVLRALYASHAAAGAVGMIETWLSYEGEPDRALLETASIHAVPDWWFKQ